MATKLEDLIGNPATGARSIGAMFTSPNNAPNDYGIPRPAPLGLHEVPGRDFGAIEERRQLRTSLEQFLRKGEQAKTGGAARKYIGLADVAMKRLGELQSNERAQEKAGAETRQTVFGQEMASALGGADVGIRQAKIGLEQMELGQKERQLELDRWTAQAFDERDRKRIQVLEEAGEKTYKIETEKLNLLKNPEAKVNISGNFLSDFKALNEIKLRAQNSLIEEGKYDKSERKDLENSYNEAVQKLRGEYRKFYGSSGGLGEGSGKSFTYIPGEGFK